MAQMRSTRDEVHAALTDPKKRKESGFRQQVGQKLSRLRKTYIATYQDLHAKARLGRNDDERKAELTRDERIGQLQKLATIELMSSAQLTEFQRRLGDLRSCFGLTPQQLGAAPVCPDCGFKPSAEPVRLPAAKALNALDDELDKLVESWTKTLLTNLDDPTVQENFDLISAQRRKLIKDFMDAGELPPKLTQAFLEALQEVLSNLTKIVVSIGDLREKLAAAGTPVTPAELKKRFDDYLDDLAKGKDPSKVRIVLE